MTDKGILIKKIQQLELTKQDKLDCYSSILARSSTLYRVLKELFDFEKGTFAEEIYKTGSPNHFNMYEKLSDISLKILSCNLLESYNFKPDNEDGKPNINVSIIFLNDLIRENS